MAAAVAACVFIPIGVYAGKKISEHIIEIAFLFFSNKMLRGKEEQEAYFKEVSQ